MLCTLVDQPFDDPNWLFEPKLDGLRVWCRTDGRRVTMLSRNEKPQDLQFPEIAEAVKRSLGGRRAVLDGEVVCLDEEGKSSFRLLQQRFHIEDRETIGRRVQEYPAFLYVFDLLHLDGRDLTALPLSERKKLLRKAVKWSDRVRWTEGTPEAGTELLRDACRRGEEGIVGKDLRSPYTAGRAAEWVKIKCSQRQEFVIGGWTDPQRSRVGLGALLVGYYDDDKFTYAGKVGTGYSGDTLRDLRERLGRIGQASSPFDAGDPPHGEHVHWVKPRLISEVAFGEWTQHDLLRHPRFEGLRMDKDPKTVRRERAKHVSKKRVVQPASGSDSGHRKAGVTAKRSATAKPSSRAPLEIPTKGAVVTRSARDVRFSHVDKVMFPEAGLTKGDVLSYYIEIANTLLPHLEDRPVTLERLPDGVGDGRPRFWQKNTPTYYPKWIPRIDLKRDDGKSVNYALVNDAETLAYLVNQGAITFHTYLSRVQDLDRPDYVVFDFDPGENKFADVVRLARGLHDVLDEQKVKSYPKTSGKSGLHVVAPWTKPAGFEEARGWAMEQAKKLVAEFPKLATVERFKDKRAGRIYVDVIQNAPGHHVVPPYVIRAIPRATVSTPLDWKEVTPKLNPAKFTTAEVLKRVKRSGDLFSGLAP